MEDLLTMRCSKRFTYWGLLILLPIVVSFGVVIKPSVAQSTLRLERLQVDLWPEYDQPDMLVIYRGTLPADTPLPAALTLRLPARVGEPSSVAYDDGTGNLFNAPYSVEAVGEWLAVTLEIAAPHFQLEFYDSLIRAGEQRSYTFVWPGDYEVGQLDLLLLPPPGAAEIQTEPTLSSVRLDTDSVSYRGALGGVAVGEEARLTVSYSGGTVSQPINGESSKNILIAVAAVVTIVSVIVGGIWYMRRPGPEPEPAPRPRRRRKLPRSQRRRRSQAGRGSGKSAARDASSSVDRCTSCGRRLQVNDRFCGSCGAPVKG